MDARRSTRTLLAGLATAALLAGSAGAASAADASPGAKPAGDGARALCKRAPKVDQRIDRALKRLDAGKARRGSVARLQQRVDNAKKAGHTEIATFLQGRLDTRESLKKDLEQRKKDLAGVKTWCAKNDGGNKDSAK
ncbi:hypothetical protein E5083_03935 [Streptomyces bauhiniae]|uniref:Uncharacterized protein n=1 Tax=Streptomyces bauhiniae TaxID=2340725 RepID=A0A4Z1DFR8_9ACTN|nr:hypothetical protein [Streptomyces bauhiniae]TGN81664.1 hypothetical protein E5083_03935 [Streptomyces bauhiniae]